jgi:hypothetical protein
MFSGVRLMIRGDGSFKLERQDLLQLLFSGVSLRRDFLERRDFLSWVIPKTLSVPWQFELEHPDWLSLLF